jgi:hypothetical protein
VAGRRDEIRRPFGCRRLRTAASSSGVPAANAPAWPARPWSASNCSAPGACATARQWLAGSNTNCRSAPDAASGSAQTAPPKAGCPGMRATSSEPPGALGRQSTGAAGPEGAQRTGRMGGAGRQPARTVRRQRTRVSGAFFGVEGLMMGLRAAGAGGDSGRAGVRCSTLLLAVAHCTTILASIAASPAGSSHLDDQSVLCGNRRFASGGLKSVLCGNRRSATASTRDLRPARHGPLRLRRRTAEDLARDAALQARDLGESSLHSPPGQSGHADPTRRPA